MRRFQAVFIMFHTSFTASVKHILILKDKYKFNVVRILKKSQLALATFCETF